MKDFLKRIVKSVEGETLIMLKLRHEMYIVSKAYNTLCSRTESEMQTLVDSERTTLIIIEDDVEI